MAGGVDVLPLDRGCPSCPATRCSCVRSRGYDCPVVVVTAVDTGVDVLSMGFDAYVTKPVDPDELLDVVGTMLARGE